MNTKNITGDSPKAFIVSFLSLRSERFFLGTMRNLSIGLIIFPLFILSNKITIESPLLSIPGLILTGWLVAFMGWGAERLWYSTAGAMFYRPLAWYAYITRVPFWFIAGGMGYTSGLLLSEKYGLFSVQDIPAGSLFAFGGMIGLFLQAVLQIRVYRFLRWLVVEKKSL